MDEQKRIPTEEWKAQKQAERQQLFDKQKSEIEKVTSSGKALTDYMVGRGRLGSHLSAGNAALVLAQNPAARKVMSMQDWNNYGRRINRGAEGISVLARRNNYWNVDKVYDLSQTYGDKPYKMLEVVSAPVDLKNALNAMASLAPVELVMVEHAEVPVRYDHESENILIQMDTPDEDTFRMLPTAMVQAYIQSVDGTQATPQVTDLYAECVSAELCGRFNLPVLPGTEERLEKLLPAFEKGEERTMLEEIGAFARTMGDRVEQEFRPLQQTRGTKLPVQPGGRE